jgi:hypothetical protein
MRSSTIRAFTGGGQTLALALILAAVGFVSLPALGVAQAGGPGGPPSYPDRGETVSLPVTAVDLFTSGVGYFQHDGVVEGDAEVTLTFSTSDINDLLKSLVLQDFDGGTVEAVTYPSQDPLARILGSFSLDIADNPPLAELINRARGAEVAVEGAVSATGTVSGVEYRTVQTDEGTEERAFLTLLTDSGFRQLPFAQMRSIRFEDRALQAELEAALHVIEENRRQDRRSVTIRFTGEGRRNVRVGYVRAVPVWKTSYRVVLDDDGRAQVQGWAIVENTGETDWADVSLGLVSGQPISFVMDLYSPIYTSRPRVEPDAGVSVAPQEYERAVDRSLAQAPRAAEEESGVGYLRRAPASEPAATGERAPIDLSRGVRAAAGDEGGAVYRIDHPVSIPRRGAALIPIVARTVPAQHVSIYDPSVVADRPLAAVRLKNATELRLPAGPATIFDGASYAGDARLPEMIAGEERLVSYAIDSDTTVLVESHSEPATFTRVTIVDGMLEVTTSERLETEYVLERVGEDEATHVVIHPKRSGWELAHGTTPIGETSDEYRFELKVAAGERETLAVAEERVTSQRMGLLDMRDDRIAYYLSARGARAAMDARTARQLERIRELRRVVAERERERREIEQAISDIHREQERIRANLDVLDAGTELYNRYLETLASQEDRLGALREELSLARERESAARNELRDYVEGV